MPISEGEVIIGSNEEPSWAFYIRDEKDTLFFWSLCDVNVIGMDWCCQCICVDMTGYTANNIIGGLRMFKRKCFTLGQLSGDMKFEELAEERFNYKMAACVTLGIEQNILTEDLKSGKLIKPAHLLTSPGYEGRGIVNYLFDFISTMWPHKIIADNLKITKGNVELI